MIFLEITVLGYMLVIGCVVAWVIFSAFIVIIICINSSDLSQKK